MIKLILSRELFDYSRNRYFQILGLVLVVLSAVASIDGWNRAREATQSRTAAEANDHEVWVNQGAAGPHSAAHFARYAFRPTPALAAFEAGILDYAGAAVWMEAHTQNPATLRRAEDTLSRAPLLALSPSWVVRVIGSLAMVVLLFPSIARERESGTMRTLAAAGVTSEAFVAGKVVAAAAAAVTVAIIAVGLSLLPGVMLGTEAIGLPQVASLVLVHAGGFVAFGLLLVAVSARCRTSGSALLGGAGLWLMWIVVVPTLGAQLATSLHPDIDEIAFKDRIQREAQAPFWKGGAREMAVVSYEKKILKEFGGKRFDELGFNRDGLELQAHEEFANQVYDRLYGDLGATHLAQDQTLGMASVVSPLLAVQRLSSGIAGTDLMAQQMFTTQAEAHRRRIIEQLNRHMMVNAGDDGFQWMAGPELWRQIADFEGQPPSFAQVIAGYWLELASLGTWLVIAGFLALHWTRRAMQVEVIA